MQTTLVKNTDERTLSQSSGAKNRFRLMSREAAIFTFFLVCSLLALVLSPLALYYFDQGEYHGRKLDIKAPDFSLTDINNQPHSLSQHLGRYTFLYFGYINCDGVCHNQVGTMFNVQKQSQRDDLDFIFVTLDPQRDSRTMLKRYFDDLGSNFYALRTDNLNQLKRITAKYQNYFYADKLIDTKAGYKLQHPGKIYLINPQGHIELIYQNQFIRYDRIIDDLNRLQQNTTQDANDLTRRETDNA